MSEANNGKGSTFSPQAGDETSNSRERREFLGFYEKYFSGDKILDVGCGHNKIVPHARGWDLANGDGDATVLDGVDRESYDTVYASHVLEHLDAPAEALLRWWEVVKPGGYLVVAVPDFELYEQNVWPSVFNSDHRNGFTTFKGKRKLPEHVLGVMDLVKELPEAKLLSLSLCDRGYDYELVKPGQPTDQCEAERQIEVVVQKEESTVPFYDSIESRIQCSCGSKDLKALGVVTPNRLWSACRRCGQRGFIGLGG